MTTQQLAAYALQPPITLFPLPNGSNNHVIGVRSGDGEFVLKTIVAPHNLTVLHHEQHLLHWLATQDLPFAVPAPLRTRDGELILHDEAGYHVLMPWLMRLRNAASTIWWFGRQLAAGEAIRLQERIDDMRQFATWLDGVNGKRFTQVLRLLTHPSENDKDML